MVGGRYSVVAMFLLQRGVGDPKLCCSGVFMTLTTRERRWLISRRVQEAVANGNTLFIYAMRPCGPSLLENLSGRLFLQFPAVCSHSAVTGATKIVQV